MALIQGAPDLRFGTSIDRSRFGPGKSYTGEGSAGYEKLER